MKYLLFVFSLLVIIACKNDASSPDTFTLFLEKEGNQFDVFIKNGQLLDGSGSAAYESDLLIKGDSIAYIGNVDTSKINSRQTIDAKGKVVTPGFIDMHAHGNPLETPAFQNFSAMGVTTIILGQDGSSPNVDIKQWLSEVAQQPLGVNIALFVGHGTLRKQSGINLEKNPTAEKLAAQQHLLKEALKAGCFGMSTGLEYIPGTFAKDTELLPLAKIVGDNKGMIMSHIRNEDDTEIENSIQELLRQGKYCNIQISHIKSVYGKGKERGKAILNLLDTPLPNGHTITADVYPYMASYTGIGIVFPEWAKPPHNYKEVVKNRRTELLAFLKQKIIDRNGPEATLFGTAPYAGKTLAQLSQEQNLPYEKVLLGIGPNRASGAYFIMDDALQTEFIAHPKVMICSDGSPNMRHPRGYGTFAKIIEEYVENRKRIRLTEAVRKMTGLSAKIVGLHRRGLLQKGYFADLLIFNPKNVKANATYENPHKLATGFDYVFVNGQLEKGGQVLGK